MKIYDAPTHSEKTLRLLELANNTDKIIACHDVQDVVHIQQLADVLHYTIAPPLTYWQMMGVKFQYNYNNPPVLIDNADIFLQQILHAPIEAITLSFQLCPFCKKDDMLRGLPVGMLCLRCEIAQPTNSFLPKTLTKDTT